MLFLEIKKTAWMSRRLRSWQSRRNATARNKSVLKSVSGSHAKRGRANPTRLTMASFRHRRLFLPSRCPLHDRAISPCIGDGVHLFAAFAECGYDVNTVHEMRTHIEPKC